MSAQIKDLKKMELVCRKDDNDSTLYKVLSGKLLVFGVEGTKVTPYAYIDAGEFVGELSFFDSSQRSAYVMALEETKLMVIPDHNKENYFPSWLIEFSKNATKRIRHLDDLINHKGIKRKNVKAIAPLSIEEQREIYQCLD